MLEGVVAWSLTGARCDGGQPTGDVESGMRGGVATIAGAVVDGGFTAWGQRRVADIALANSLCDQSREDATKLFSAYTELRCEIRPLKASGTTSFVAS